MGRSTLTTVLTHHVGQTGTLTGHPVTLPAVRIRTDWVTDALWKQGSEESGTYDIIHLALAQAVSQHNDTSKNTRAWAVSQHTDTGKNAKAWAVSQHTDTGKNAKAWAVSQHTDTSKNTKAWAVSQHTDTGKNTKAWAVSQHTDTGKNTKAWAVSQHTDTGKNTKAHYDAVRSRIVMRELSSAMMIANMSNLEMEEYTIIYHSYKSLSHSNFYTEIQIQHL